MSLHQCDAFLCHGPGHQSKTDCELPAGHDGKHETHYHGGQRARWTHGAYTAKLREQGVDFSPTSYPEGIGMTGFFDEPPEDNDD